MRMFIIEEDKVEWVIEGSLSNPGFFFQTREEIHVSG